MGNVEDGLKQLKSGLESLLDPVALSEHVAVAAASERPSQPSTTLMHVRFLENKANVEKLAHYLWLCAQNYSLSRRRRIEIQKQISEAAPGDLSVAGLVTTTVRNAFLEFNKAFPHRSSEVGELLAYCVALEQLGATQLLAKMALKTNNNMPVHGLDGIHGKVENGWLNLFFLESKLSSSANAGAKEFAESIAEFSNNTKQYQREYQLVKELGNLDALPASDKELALEYFDVFGSSSIPKRERYIGIILYSDAKAFDAVPPVDDDYEPHYYEKFFSEEYAKQLSHHQEAVLKHLQNFGATPENCRVYFVVVPDANELREMLYQVMGYVPPKKIPASGSEEREANAPKKASAVKKAGATPRKAPARKIATRKAPK